MTPTKTSGTLGNSWPIRTCPSEFWTNRAIDIALPLITVLGGRQLGLSNSRDDALSEPAESLDETDFSWRIGLGSTRGSSKQTFNQVKIIHLPFFYMVNGSRYCTKYHNDENHRSKKFHGVNFTLRRDYQWAQSLWAASNERLTGLKDGLKRRCKNKRLRYECRLNADQRWIWHAPLVRLGKEKKAGPLTGSLCNLLANQSQQLGLNMQTSETIIPASTKSRVWVVQGGSDPG